MPELLYPKPPSSLETLRPRHLLAYVGPGVIIASVTIGSGELVWASRSGATFGYTLLWCFLYGGLFKAIQVYTAGRHITLTGEHPMVTWKKLPGPPLWFPLLIAVPFVLIMPIGFSGISETLGGYVQRLAGLPMEGTSVGVWAYHEWWENVWGALLLTGCLILAMSSSYSLLERVSVVVLLVLVCCVAAAVLVFQPDMTQLLAGLLVPTVPTYPDWVLKTPEYAEEFSGRSPWLEVSVYLSAVGGGAYDYVGYVGMLRNKRWGLAGRRIVSRAEMDAAVATDNEAAVENLKRASTWVRAPLLDTGLSFFFVILVTLLFAILGTLVLHTAGVIPASKDFLSEQERFLTHFHTELRWLYRTGVFLAFIGTMYGAFEVLSYTVIESLRALIPKMVTPERIPYVRRGVIAYCFLGGMLLLWLPQSIAGNVTDRFTLASLLSGALSCGLWCFAMLWADHVRLPKPLRMGLTMKIAVLIAGVSMTVLGAQTLYAYFTGTDNS